MIPKPMPAPARPPLRLLVVTASPSDRMSLSVEGEASAIEKALQPLGQQVAVMRLAHATGPALHQHLIDAGPHVLHFAGHGDFDGREGALVLEDGAGRAEWLPGAVLATLLKGTNVRLARLPTPFGQVSIRAAFVPPDASSQATRASADGASHQAGEQPQLRRRNLVPAFVQLLVAFGLLAWLTGIPQSPHLVALSDKL